jgi:hypothetical protein
MNRTKNGIYLIPSIFFFIFTCFSAEIFKGRQKYLVLLRNEWYKQLIFNLNSHVYVVCTMYFIANSISFPQTVKEFEHRRRRKNVIRVSRSPKCLSSEIVISRNFDTQKYPFIQYIYVKFIALVIHIYVSINSNEPFERNIIIFFKFVTRKASLINYDKLFILSFF